MLVIVEQFLNGLQFGLLLFLLAAGLTLVFGIMNLVNLAHGALYMVGAYLTTYFTQQTGSFGLGVLLGLAGTLLVGIVTELVALRTLYERDHLDQVLATFGLILFFNELVAILWGRTALYLAQPDWLQGHIELVGGSRYLAQHIPGARHVELPGSDHAIFAGDSESYAVEIERFEPTPDGRTEIDAVIWVERPGQRKIVIGADGARLKAIGQAARLALNDLFGRRVHLSTWVKVREGWTDDDRMLRRLGHDAS